jgi:type IV secretory pathway VirB3-like protein
MQLSTMSRSPCIIGIHFHAISSEMIFTRHLFLACNIELFGTSQWALDLTHKVTVKFCHVSIQCVHSMLQNRLKFRNVSIQHVYFMSQNACLVLEVIMYKSFLKE